MTYEPNRGKVSAQKNRCQISNVGLMFGNCIRDFHLQNTSMYTFLVLNGIKFIIHSFIDFSIALPCIRINKLSVRFQEFFFTLFIH